MRGWRRQESALRLFAQAGVAAQQRHLAELSGPERTMAEAITNHQADAFAKDPYAAGTSLYPMSGLTVGGRRRGPAGQTRMIEARRGAPTEAMLTQVKASPSDLNAAEPTHDVQVAQDEPPELQETTRSKAEDLYRDQKARRVPWELAKEQLDRQNVPRVDHDAAEQELRCQQAFPGAPRPATPDRDEPAKMPPWNDPSSEEWMGDIVKLPDGSLI